VRWNIDRVGILATETSLQILQLKLMVQLVGYRVIGTWLYRGLVPALLKQLNQFHCATTFPIDRHAAAAMTIENIRQLSVLRGIEGLNDQLRLL
jgi:hypothetical protein